MIYFFIIIAVFLTSWICRMKFSVGIHKMNGTSIYMCFWSIILVAISGLRSEEIGRDTRMYGYLFTSSSYIDTIQEYFSQYEYTEYLYYGINYISSQIMTYQQFLLIMAIISIIPVMFIIYRYSKYKSMSIFLFITMGYFTFSMSGLRQAAAMGCIMLAYHFMKEKRLKSFLLIVFISTLFHSSAILFLPVYWLEKIPLKKPTIIISIVAISSAYIFKSKLWFFASVFARQQYGSNDAGGEKMYLFMLLTVVLGFIYSNKFINSKGYISTQGEDKDNKILLYLQILAAILWPIASVNSATFRMYYYYHIFIILFVPELLLSIKNKNSKFIIGSGYIFVGVYFVVTQILPVTQQFYPFAFFWE